MKIWEALDFYANVEREKGITQNHSQKHLPLDLFWIPFPKNVNFTFTLSPICCQLPPVSQHGGQWGNPDIIAAGIWTHHVYVWLVLESRQCCLYKPVISYCGSQSYSYYPQRVYDLKHSQERTKEHHVNSHYSLQMCVCVCTWIASVEAGSVQEPVGSLAHFSGQRQPATFS